MKLLLRQQQKVNNNALMLIRCCGHLVYNFFESILGLMISNPSLTELKIKIRAANTLCA